MGFEFDFQPVGDGERSGDAIALRYTAGALAVPVIHVVDGGDLAAGGKLVAHINAQYGNPRRIENVVLTHGDDDHSSGLRTVIDTFEIGAIWMNRPWLYAGEIVHLFRDGRWTVDGLSRRLREDFPILAEIEDKAYERGIPIREAFQGAQIGAFTVLAPSRTRYLSLIPQIERTPEAASAHHPNRGLLGFAKDAVNWIRESWGQETLGEDAQTAASNETSVVQYGFFEGKPVLLTGDAGVNALTEAANYRDLLGYEPFQLDMMQMPHHGSRRNVTPTILNRWLGPPLMQGQPDRGITAIASVSNGDPTKPRKKVSNAFLRRGATPYRTNGGVLHHNRGMPPRGWGSAPAITFSDAVEE